MWTPPHARAQRLVAPEEEEDRERLLTTGANYYILLRTLLDFNEASENHADAANDEFAGDEEHQNEDESTELALDVRLTARPNPAPPTATPQLRADRRVSEFARSRRTPRARRPSPSSSASGSPFSTRAPARASRTPTPRAGMSGARG